MKRNVMNIRDSYVIGPNVKKKKQTATPPKMEVWKMMFLCHWVILRFHGDFQGCMLIQGYQTETKQQYHPIGFMVEWYIYRSVNG